MASKMSKRFTGLLNRTKSHTTPPPGAQTNSDYNFDNAPAGSPEANLGYAIRTFCESPSAAGGGEEVLHLPVIVDAAESSPVAAAAAAQQIRKFLGREWAVKPHVQYNAIMLIRILSDNPGPSFTRNFDKTFVSTVKECLRMCKDSGTQQILRETLDSLEANKQFQEGMEDLIRMWRKEKGTQASFGSSHQQPPPGDWRYRQPSMGIQQPQQDYQHGGHSSRARSLPPPVELASRIEEARNTAKILLQLIQSTPSEEVLNNDLVKEFADRCQTAQRSMQGYINCENPAPDDDTMLTLIETNEQLSLASSRYQRSILSARKALGLSPPPNAEGLQNPDGTVAAPVGPPPGQSDNLFNMNPVSQQQPPQQTWSPPPQPPPKSPSRGLSSEETYMPPPGPPPKQSPTSANSNDAFSAPPGPPPSMLARLNSREGQQSPPQTPPSAQAPQIPPVEQTSNPFADPVEHESNPPPLSVEPGYYGNSSATTQSHPANRPHSHTFSIDSGPTYLPPSSRDGENARTSGSGPALFHSSQQAWQQSGSTPSYVGRQNSAANGLNMHGAGPNNVPEIDGHSEVGRSPTRVRRTGTEEDPDDAYSVSPVQTRGQGL